MSFWKPNTPIKRAVKRYMRVLGVDEKTNEHAANLMLVWFELYNNSKHYSDYSKVGREFAKAAKKASRELHDFIRSVREYDCAASKIISDAFFELVWVSVPDYSLN